jgi:hypothetical protein
MRKLGIIHTAEGKREGSVEEHEEIKRFKSSLVLRKWQTQIGDSGLLLLGEINLNNQRRSGIRGCCC